MTVWMAICEKTKSWCTYARCPIYYGKDFNFDNYRLTCPHKIRKETIKKEQP